MTHLVERPPRPRATAPARVTPRRLARLRLAPLLLLAPPLCLSLGACKGTPTRAVAPLSGPARHACDRRLPSTREHAKLCVEHLGPATTEAGAQAACAALPEARYRGGPCPPGAIGRCALAVGAPDERHELTYQGNFEEVGRDCRKRGGQWQPL